jgi:hypothetical protein
MNKFVAALITLVITLTSCKKYYNCDCTRVVQVLTSQSTAVNPTYSTSTTTYTMPVNSTTTAKANTACVALGGDDGLTTITCSIIN